MQNIRAQHFPDLPASPGGRPTKLSPQNKRFCIRAITSGHIQTGVAVTKKLESELGVKVCDRTVRNALHEAGLGAMEKEKRPKLSAKNIRARLQFAKLHQYWTISDWERVIFSDETKINRFCSDGRQWCWIRDGESRQDRHVKQTVKHGGGNVKIWGCMTAQGPGFMCKIEGFMNQHLYKQILEDELKQTIKYYGMKSDELIFQHDNDPKHTAGSVQTWLDKQPFGVLEWPSQSPDLNPIEHLWASLKRRLNEYENPPKGMLELWDRIQAKWEQLDAEVCKKLVASMPHRISAVLKAKGKWTDY